MEKLAKIFGRFFCVFFEFLLGRRWWAVVFFLEKKAKKSLRGAVSCRPRVASGIHSAYDPPGQHALPQNDCVFWVNDAQRSRQGGAEMRVFANPP